MAVPTVTSISPSSGHAGGRAIVEMIGTGFQLEPDPDVSDPDTVPLPEPAPPVRVTFGSREAPEVRVWSSTRMWVLTPKGDPFDQATSWDSVDAATDTITAAAHELIEGTRVQLDPDALEAGGVFPGGLDPADPYWLVDVTPNTFRLAASSGGPAIDLTDAGAGALAMLSDGAVDVTVENIDSAGVPIPGETVTVTKAYKPLRPNLSIKSHLSEVIDTLMGELRRQVVRDVSWTTQMDYDEETGDLTIGFLARTPALVIAGLQAPRNRQHAVNQQEEVNLNDPATEGDFVVLRPPQVVDLVGTLVGVSDDPDEVANLAQASVVFFQKNTTLEVLRDPSDPSQGVIEYDLRSSVEDELNFTPIGNNTDLTFFTTDVRVIGVRLQSMPGIEQDRPPGVPANLPVEPIVGIGKTADTISLSPKGKSDE